MSAIAIRSAAWALLLLPATALAWSGWHLSPVARCVLDQSSDTTLVGFSHDGCWVAALKTHTATRDVSPVARVWNAWTARLVAATQAPFSKLAVHDANHRVCSTGTGWRFLIERADNGQMRLACGPEIDPGDGPNTLAVRCRGVLDLASADGSRVCRVREDQPDGPAEVWDAALQARIATLPDGFFAHAFSKNGRYLVGRKSANYMDPVCVWDCEVNRMALQFKRGQPYCLSFHAESLASFDLETDRLTVVSLADGTSVTVRRPRGSDEPAGSPPDFNRVCIAVSDDGRLLGLLQPGERFGWMIPVASPTRAQRFCFPEPLGVGDWIDVCGFTPDGKFFFLEDGGGNRRAYWDISTQSPRLYAIACGCGLRGSKQDVGVVLARPGNTGSGVNTELAPTKFGPSLGFLAGQYGIAGGRVPLVNYHSSPDSRWLTLSGNYFWDQGQIWRWFLGIVPSAKTAFPGQTGETALFDFERLRLDAQWTDSKAALFSPDGRSLALQHDDGRITVWDLPPGRPFLLPLAMHLPLLMVVGLFARSVRRSRWRRRSFCSVAGSTVPPSSPSPGATGSPAIA